MSEDSHPTTKKRLRQQFHNARPHTLFPWQQMGASHVVGFTPRSDGIYCLLLQNWSSILRCHGYKNIDSNPVLPRDVIAQCNNLFSS